ncbi:predicted protein [Coccidioides posadasii str. Silveira]|uniref:Predicted protein n=1 Tax=Coccidioides posadasii (strain RMSCC 757 / Silveira) TaxID=443226 RepID=E9CY47_COCPS|nr:predicted protein [Coccidioides posadasii str. Silveira]
MHELMQQPEVGIWEDRVLRLLDERSHAEYRLAPAMYDPNGMVAGGDVGRIILASLQYHGWMGGIAE